MNTINEVRRITQEKINEVENRGFRMGFGLSGVTYSGETVQPSGRSALCILGACSIGAPSGEDVRYENAAARNLGITVRDAEQMEAGWEGFDFIADVKSEFFKLGREFRNAFLTAK